MLYINLADENGPLFELSFEIIDRKIMPDVLLEFVPDCLGSPGSCSSLTGFLIMQICAYTTHYNLKGCAYKSTLCVSREHFSFQR